eukprot:jgi/Phyca11/131813/e_gw1.116.19.1
MPKRRADNIDQSSNAEKSNDEHSVSLPVYTPILAPKLTSISHEALVRWDKRRREYEAKMKACCRPTGEDYVVVTQNVTETFDSETLDAFFTLKLRKDVADVTEDELIAEIKGLLAKVKNDDLPNIKDLFASELKMNMWCSGSRRNSTRGALTHRGAGLPTNGGGTPIDRGV